ncbi:11652_t:CDS:10 [Funneliformis mosseae]|uniref:11652_t:CDS:1 n=1 Tax=Funneliformis mosseae TaxID=27381 RepID=A0A9N9GKJ4_FUNMO|nr:11652_t:CDS:10 [Funneliformis mosseae]
MPFGRSVLFISSCLKGLIKIWGTFPVKSTYIISGNWKKGRVVLGLRNFHVTNLYELLQKSLYEHNYCRASEILEVLLQCPDCDLSRIWQPAIKVLFTLDPTSTTFIEFFNILLLKNHALSAKFILDKQRIIMELVFYQMKYGNATDALATAETYLPMEPYCNNPVLHGYTGLLAYSLWEQLNTMIKENEPKPEIYKPPKRKNSSKKHIPPREKLKRNRNDYKEEIEIPEIDEQFMDRRKRYYEMSLSNFKRSLDLDMSNDMFLIYSVKLLLHNEEIEEAITVIQNFCDNNPSVLTGHRLLFEVLHTYKSFDSKWVEVGQAYHRIDPVSPPEKVLNPLIEHYTQVIKNTIEEEREILVDAYYNICELLFQRIEHGDDNPNYLYKTIESFVWLEYFDNRQKVKVKELLQNRGEWFREYLFYTQRKVVNSLWEHQCYKILSACLSYNEPMGGKLGKLAEKVREYILAGNYFRYERAFYNFVRQSKKHNGINASRLSDLDSDNSDDNVEHYGWWEEMIGTYQTHDT